MDILQGSQESSFQTQSLPEDSGNSSSLADSSQLVSIQKSNSNAINRISGSSPSGYRLNLLESIDGEISGSHSSSLKSSNSTNSINFSTDINNTNSLLKKAQDTTWKSFYGADITQKDGLEWSNLSTSNMHEICRPEPLGFARNDPDSIGTPLPTRTQRIPLDSINVSSINNLSYNTTVSSTNQPSMVNQDINSINHTREQSKDVDSIQESIRELSHTSSLESAAEGSVSQLLNKVKDPAKDLEFQNYSSLASSLTMPSYKEISPKSIVKSETPITKLLGPSYKHTQKFLKDLKQVKLAYGSEKSSLISDSSKDNDVTKSFDSKSEACQVGASQLHYSTMSSLLDADDVPHHEDDELVEQDIASASALNEQEKIGCLKFDSILNKGDNLEHCFSLSAESKQESEGELLLSELTDPLMVSSKKGSSSSTMKNDNSSSQDHSQGSSQTSSYILPTLTPIQEVLSPTKEKPVHPKNLRYTKGPHKEVLMLNPSIDIPTYQMFQSNHISSASSTPHDVDFTVHTQAHIEQLRQDTKENSGQRRGIYDIRNSTSPGSSNRKRLLAGKQPRSKAKPLNEPFEVYVSEDSKLTESLRSVISQKVDDNVKDISTRYKYASGIQDDSTVTKYIPDTRIKDITDRFEKSSMQSSCEQIDSSEIRTITTQPTISSTTAESSETSSFCQASTATDNTDKLVTSMNTFVSDISLAQDTIGKSQTELNAQCSKPYTPGVVPATDAKDKSSIFAANHLLDKQKHCNKNAQTNTAFTPPKVYEPSYSIERSRPRRAWAEPTPNVDVKLNDRTHFSGLKPQRNKASKQPHFDDDIAMKNQLNKLWHDFDSSFKNDANSTSPILQKLEMLSKLLIEQKKKRAMSINSSSNTSSSLSSTVGDSTTSVVGSTPNYQLKKTKNKKTTKVMQEQTANTNNISNGSSIPCSTTDISSSEDNSKIYEIKTPIVSKPTKTVNKPADSTCPYCSKRSVGTNCPTPCVSDSEIEQPLMVQTWTQTTPNILEKHPISVWIEKTEKRKQIPHKNKKQHIPKLKLKEKSNGKNLEDVENQDPYRKETYRVEDAVTSPVKMQDSKITFPLQNKKIDKKGVCTAWFQTVRSDASSDIVPLSEIPKFSDLHPSYSKARGEKHYLDISRSVDQMTLQEAFSLHKQTFIHRMRQRVQDVKDARLHDKLTNNFYVSIPRKRRIKPQKRREIQLPLTLAKKVKERHPRKLVDENSPREIYRQEEEKQALLRQNRLKMKQYDSKIRKHFLKDQPSHVTKNCFVVRH